MSDESPNERKAVRLVVSSLRRDASAHEAGELVAIGRRFDQVQLEVISLCGEVPEAVGFSFTFWDYWIDARNHEWQYYEGVGCDDWPRLARHLADAVESGVPFTDPLLVSLYQRIGSPGLFDRILDWLRSRSGSA